VVAAAFFLSGAAALIYQVTWQRRLALHSGVGIYSVAMIVAAFMVGLGLGSHVGGVLCVRLPPRTALPAFAALELAIGLFGLASGRLYYDWLYLRAGGLYATPWRAAMCTWGPTARVRRTFLRAMPHVLELADGSILLGSNRPLALDLAAWEERVMSDAVRSYLGDDRAREVRSTLQTARPAAAVGMDEDVNRDLVPRDEFNRP
jgi:hypothetical protein